MVFFSGFREKLHGGSMCTPGCQGKVEALHECNGFLNAFPTVLRSEPARATRALASQARTCHVRSVVAGLVSRNRWASIRGLLQISALRESSAGAACRGILQVPLQRPRLVRHSFARLRKIFGRQLVGPRSMHLLHRARTISESLERGHFLK